MGRPKIRHIAIMSRDTERLAQFYKSAFQMEEINRSSNPGVRAIYLTDGYLNLALLPCRLEGDSATGLNHFGWQIDDQDEMNRIMADHGMEEPKMRPSNRPYAEFRGCDPDGNLFDLAKSFDREDKQAAPAKKVPAE